MQVARWRRYARLVRAALNRARGRPFPDISHLLHHAREVEFARLPRGLQHVVSVGCAGTWYFDWIEKTCGPLKKHIGVEFYTPRPPGLPDHVEWIKNTAGHMPEIASECTECVISGQNLEHLWPEDVVGFLEESHRILQPNGLLVVDSPNRLITHRYDWSHPEHTVELTPGEAAELVTAAGFDVTEVKGLWLCESTRSGRLLKFDDMPRRGEDSVTRRLQAAREHADRSFLWWVEARKSSRRPDTARLRARMQEIWDSAWPERCRRTLTRVGRRSRDGTAFESTGWSGALMYGPYLPLRRGAYTVTFDLEVTNGFGLGSRAILCEVAAGGGSEVLSSQEVRVAPSECGRPFPVTLAVRLDRTVFGVEFRVFVPWGMRVRVKRDIQLRARDNAW